MLDRVLALTTVPDSEGEAQRLRALYAFELAWQRLSALVGEQYLEAPNSTQ